MVCLKRNLEVKVRFSKDELEALTKKIRKTNFSREGFIRHSANSVVVKEAPSADFSMLIREVRRVGSNIDQLLKTANAKGLLDVPQLRRSLEQNRAVEEMLWDTFTMSP